MIVRSLYEINKRLHRAGLLADEFLLDEKSEDAFSIWIDAPICSIRNPAFLLSAAILLIYNAYL